MIFTETREGRRFVGEVPPGQPLCATLHALAVNYRIASGWAEGSGYVRDAQLRPLLRDGSLGEVVLVPGVSLIASMRAILSEKDGAVDLVVRVLLATEGEPNHAGVLVEATSASVELMLQTFDDITLRRFDDPRSQHARWLDVAVRMVTGESETVRSGRVAMEAMPSRLLEQDEMPVLKAGDALEHPRLGTCVVTQVIDQDRVAIRMQTGKIAQLHLGLLTLTRAGLRQGRPVYDVQVRRRQSL